MSLSRFRGATYGVRKLSGAKTMSKDSGLPSKRWGRPGDSDGVYRRADGGGYVGRVATRGHGMAIAVFLLLPWVEPDQFAAQGAEFGWWDFEVFALFGVAAQAR